jgi:hypothetical protein
VAEGGGGHDTALVKALRKSQDRCQALLLEKEEAMKKVCTVCLPHSFSSVF